MKKKLLLVWLGILVAQLVYSQSQFGINTDTPKSSAVLDIVSSDKGVLIPRLSTTQRTSITSPDTGLLVYDSTLQYFYYYDGGGWTQVPGGSPDELSDADNDTKVQVEETADEDKIRFDLGGTERWVMQGSRLEPLNSGNSVFVGEGAGAVDDLTTNNNVFVGYEAGVANITGQRNIAIGYRSMYQNITGPYNIGIGYQALYSNSSGAYNTVVGYNAMSTNSTGTHNTAFGGSALGGNTTGIESTAVGYQCLSTNTTGEFNTAVGYQTMFNNTTGKHNVAMGGSALASNNTGWYNTGVGRQAVWRNTSGNNNTGFGYFAVAENTTGTSNTGVGYQALYHNKTGSNNVAIGENAGFGSAAVDLSQCTFAGSNSYPTVARTNVTMLGYGIANAQCTGDNQVLLGNTSVAQIRAQVTSITAYSDARFKTNVKEDVKGLDFILKLKPVTYNQDPEKLHDIWGTSEAQRKNLDHSDIKKQRFIGFLAQDVEQAAEESGFHFPGIDVPGNANEVYSLRYVDFIMPMVRAMQEQQEMIEQQKEVNDQLRSEVDQLLIWKASMEALSAGE